MLTAKEAAPTVVLSPEEVQGLTGYRQPSRQLAVLRDLGFWRARRSVTGEVILERAHYEAVQTGEFSEAPQVIVSSVEVCRRRAPARPMDWNAKTALYRHFDKSGALLYVGIAVDPAKRESAHRCYAEWSSKIERIEVEWHDNRHAAVEAERAAIAAERPKFNILHTGRRLAYRR